MPYYTGEMKYNNTDLNMYHCGTEKCSPGHHYGPAVRDHFLIHYVISGKGKFEVGNNTYHLEKGQGFLIYPGIVTYYQADFEDPWNYSWVGFHGLKAEHYLELTYLKQDNPIFLYDRDDYIKNCLDEMNSISQYTKYEEMKLIGLLYLFLSRLIEYCGTNSIIPEPETRKEMYVKKAVEYIEKNYSRKITIASLSSYIGIDRKYLGLLFKQYLNITPQNFLINYRINRACDFMKNASLSVGDISRSVGYEDPLLFSKVFKKVKSVCPKEYRKELRIKD